MKIIIIKKLEKILAMKGIIYGNIKFLAGDASNRKYFNIQIENQNYVLMYDNNPESLRKFIRVSNLLSKLITIPKIFFDLREHNILIIENFGNKKFSNIINKSNQSNLYFLAIEALVYIHRKGKDFKLNNYDHIELINESNLFFEWFLEKNGKIKKQLKRDFNNLFSPFLDLLEKIPKVFIHRDYHVDNLFLIEDKREHLGCGWIDYQDALIGPCVYDIVSLLQDARIDVPTSVEKKMIDYYLNSFMNIDKNIFDMCYKIIAIQRHLKVLGIFKRLAIRDNKKNYLIHIPRVIKMLEKNLSDTKFQSLSKIIKPLLNHG